MDVVTQELGITNLLEESLLKSVLWPCNKQFAWKKICAQVLGNNEDMNVGADDPLDTSRATHVYGRSCGSIEVT
jgi:hypothetical protein